MPRPLCFRSPMLIAALAGAMWLNAHAQACSDGLRNLKPGEPIPSVSIGQLDQGAVSTASWRGGVTIVVCLASQQRPSELAALDSRDVARTWEAKGLKLFHLSTEAPAREYFRTFRSQRAIDTPFLMDESRAFADAIGIIVLPTTLVLRKDGTLAHVISLHGDDYRDRLDAYVRHAQGELTDAQLEEQLKVKPVAQASPSNRGAAHRTLAKSLLDKGELEAAKAELNKALELDPANEQASLDLADVHLRMGKLPECEAVLTQVLKQTPDQPRATLLRLFLMVRQEQYVEAEPLLVAALAITPQPERIHAYLGLVYERTGKPDKAMQHYKSALSRTIKERF